MYNVRFEVLNEYRLTKIERFFSRHWKDIFWWCSGGLWVSIQSNKVWNFAAVCNWNHFRWLPIAVVPGQHNCAMTLLLWRCNMLQPSTTNIIYRIYPRSHMRHTHTHTPATTVSLPHISLLTIDYSSCIHEYLGDWIHHWIIILLRPSRPAIPPKSIQIEFRKLILVNHGQHSIFTGWFKV